MGVETKTEYPFSVDTWTQISKKEPFHFLTHAHKDHTAGIVCHGTFPIYCTHLTQKLVCRQYPKLNPSIFEFLEVGEPRCISNEDEVFSVTAYDANHCAGAVMLLFEGAFGKVLHTGDCRLTTECLNQLRSYYVRNSGRALDLDCLYLDCTFGNTTMVMPSKEEAVEQVKRCIWNHPNDAEVYLACDMLGQESLLEAVAKSFGVKIFVDRSRLSNYYGDLEIVAPNFLTVEKESTRFEVCQGYPKLYERATEAMNQAKKEGRVQPLFIRPSTQWYTSDERLEGDGSGVLSAPSISSRFGGAKSRSVTSSSTKATKDEFGVWHVCYSMHSSRGELERALEVLNPAEVISTTPHCGACDLTKSSLSTTNPIIVNEATNALLEHCILEDREIKRGKREYSCSPSKVVTTVSNVESPVPLFGSAQFALPPSPPVPFPSPCSAVPVTAPPPPPPPPPCSLAPSPAVLLSSHIPTQNARAKRLFVEPEPELEKSSAATKSLCQTPSKRRYGSNPISSPVDEPVTSLQISSPPYSRSISMPYPPSVSEGDILSVRSKSLSRLPSRRRFRIPDPLPSLLDMKRNEGMS